MPVNTTQGLPGIPQAPIADKNGNTSTIWYSFFLSLWTRTGGASGSISAVLDNITTTVGSIVYRGAAVWQGLNPSAAFTLLRMGAAVPQWDTLTDVLDSIVKTTGALLYRAAGSWQGLAAGAPATILRMGAEVPEWDTISSTLDSIGSTEGDVLYRGAAGWAALGPQAQFNVLQMGAGLPVWAGLDGNNFGAQGANHFFTGPAGAGGIPTFRLLASSDLASVAGQIPGTATNDNAAAGDVGEYVFSEIAAGAAVALTTGTPTNITSIPLTAGDWNVWGNVVTAPAGTTTQSNIKGWAHDVSATDPSPPNQGCYAEMQTAIAAGLKQVIPLGMKRISVPVDTTMFLSTTVDFATSTLSVYGFIGARRSR